MIQFRPGDKVRRIATGMEHEGIHKGDTYVVSHVLRDGFRLHGVKFPTYWYNQCYFELAHEGDEAEDLVNHPSHYTSDPSGVECITITRHRNFNIGNAFKYLWRNGLKDSAAKSAREKQVEDLRKAIFYIEDEIKRIEAQA